MRKIVLLLIALGAFLGSTKAQGVWDGTAASWSKGAGSESDPFLIESPSHLAFLGEEVRKGNTFEGKYFKQTASLNMGAKELGKEKGNFLPIGIYDTGTKPDTGAPFDNSKRFNGVYDGNNECLHNLYQFYSNTEAKTIGGHGLFGALGVKGEVRNLFLTSECTFDGDQEGGSFAAYLEGKIVNCGSKASVNGTIMIGGLAGILHGGEVRECYFRGAVKGSFCVAGIAGFAEQLEGKLPSISDSYVNASINCSGFFAGGAIGMLGAKPILKNIYVTGEMSGEGSMSGGFLGELDPPVKKEKDKLNITHCFYDKERLKRETAGYNIDVKGVDGVTTESLKGTEVRAKLGDKFVADSENKNDGFPILARHANLGTEIMGAETKTLSYRITGNSLSVENSSQETLLLYDATGNSIGKSNGNTVILPYRGLFFLCLGTQVAKVVY